MASSGCKQTRTRDDDEHLGSDQLMEILSWMPAKAVIKFSCLSKSLSSLVSDPVFVERQTIRSSLKGGGVFIQPTFEDNRDLEFHVLPRDDGGPPSSFGIPDESLSFLLEQYSEILGSSQGLLLIRKQRQVVICNPATRCWASLPIPEWVESRGNCFVFECHHDHPSAYTIIVPGFGCARESDPGFKSYNIAVYRNGRWEEDLCDLRLRVRQHDMLRLGMPVGVFRGCDGGLVVHYLCDGVEIVGEKMKYMETYMVAYDISRKAESRTFKLPEDAWKPAVDGLLLKVLQLKIFKWRWRSAETVCLVRLHQNSLSVDHIFTVWVLEDYERGSWRRVLRKTTSEMDLPEEDLKEGKMTGFYVVNERGLVFATTRRVYTYEMIGTHAGRLEVVADHHIRSYHVDSIMLYANTLRPVFVGESSRVVTF